MCGPTWIVKKMQVLDVPTGNALDVPKIQKMQNTI